MVCLYQSASVTMQQQILTCFVDKVLFFSCSGGSLEVDLYFAEEAGLVNLMSSGYEMELVAPW